MPGDAADTSLTDVDVIYACLDGFALRMRSPGKASSVPVQGASAPFPMEHLLALELRAGELFAAWKGCLDNLVARGLRAQC